MQPKNDQFRQSQDYPSDFYQNLFTCGEVFWPLQPQYLLYLQQNHNGFSLLELLPKIFLRALMSWLWCAVLALFIFPSFKKRGVITRCRMLSVIGFIIHHFCLGFLVSFIIGFRVSFALMLKDICSGCAPPSRYFLNFWPNAHPSFLSLCEL